MGIDGFLTPDALTGFAPFFNGGVVSAHEIETQIDKDIMAKRRGRIPGSLWNVMGLVNDDDGILAETMRRRNVHD